MIEKNNGQNLSVNRFKLPNGEMRLITDMNAEEKVDFVLANLLKNTIEILEMSTPVSQNDRVFSRSKFEIMKHFHEAQNTLHLKN